MVEHPTCRYEGGPGFQKNTQTNSLSLSLIHSHIHIHSHKNTSIHKYYLYRDNTFLCGIRPESQVTSSTLYKKELLLSESMLRVSKVDLKWLTKQNTALCISKIYYNERKHENTHQNQQVNRIKARWNQLPLFESPLPVDSHRACIIS